MTTRDFDEDYNNNHYHQESNEPPSTRDDVTTFVGERPSQVSTLNSDRNNTFNYYTGISYSGSQILAQVTSANKNNKWIYTAVTENTICAFDQPFVSESTSTYVDKDNFIAGTSFSPHNSNGYPSGLVNVQPEVKNSQNAQTPRCATYFYLTAYDGRVLQSIEVISPGFNQFDGTTQVFQHYFFYDMNKQYLGSYTIELNIQMNGIKTFKRYYNVTNPPVNYSQHGVSDAGGHAVGFDNEKSGWGFVAGNAHFYLADFFQPIGTYWDAKPKTPFGGDGFI